MNATEAVETMRGDLAQTAERWTGARLWSEQREILKIMSRPGARLAVRTGHSVGKTYAAAALICAFLPTHRNARVVTTAPTWLQVQDLLWAEVNRLHSESDKPLGGKCDTTRWRIDKNWFAVGLSTDDKKRFQGHHAAHLLLVFDEASGVREDIWEAAESLMAGQDVRWLAIGNPLSAHGSFAKCFTGGSGWKTMHISCQDSPNISGEMDIPGGVTQTWIDAMAEKWGTDSAFYKSRVLGEFPDDEEDESLVPLAWITQATERATKASGAKVLGVDVARYGADETVVCVRQGGRIVRLVGWRKKALTETAGRVIAIAREEGVPPCRIAVDDTGVGGGLTDNLDEHYNTGTQRKGKVTAVNFGSKPDDDEHYENAKAEIYWRLREALDPGKGGDLALPDDEDLLGGLRQRYRFTSRGKLAIESKDQVKARLGRSPDRADALALTYANPKEAVVPRVRIF